MGKRVNEIILMQEHGEHQSMITTKHMYQPLQNTEMLIFIFIINASLALPITAPIFIDEEFKI